ncbi:MAG TPA: hypothetical protein VGK22_11460 [Candidatus Angelobacter sp.]|jgi:hypothetical protein
MQEWLNQHIAFAVPFFVVTPWVVVAYWIALLGGWRLLAKRFRLQGEFTGAKWNMQSASMRFASNYNNVLTVGADSTGLFVVPLILFRARHPPLFVPWNEISISRTTKFYFFRFVVLRLGLQEDIPFRIRPTLATKIQAAAGAAWPEHKGGMELQQPPPPIG